MKIDVSSYNQSNNPFDILIAMYIIVLFINTMNAMSTPYKVPAHSQNIQHNTIGNCVFLALLNILIVLIFIHRPSITQPSSFFAAHI